MVTLLTVKQTAERLQVSDSTVRKMVANGLIDAKFVYHISASDVRIHPDYFAVQPPSNLTPFARPVSNDTLDRLVDRAIDRIAARIAGLAMESRRTA